jgi:hypothetical protein
VSEREKERRKLLSLLEHTRVEMISKQAAKNPKLAAGMSFKSLCSRLTRNGYFKQFK